ncbi:MAG: hypothetical protein RL073_625 [Actinomycetota bacterium]|jgi:hypothetical protein
MFGRPSSPFARAVLPIAGGIVFFAALFGVTWLMATYVTNNTEVTPTTGDRTFAVGEVADIAKSISESGPVLYPDLRDPLGKRSIVIDHNGTDVAKGWQVYYAYPADRTDECLVTQIEKTDTFTDCEGRALTVEQLMPPTDVRPIVENKKTLLIDLRGTMNPVTP